MTEAIVGVVQGTIVAKKYPGSPFSDTVAVLMTSRTTPSAPTGLAATSSVEGIIVSWTKPTTDTGGSTLATGAIAGYWVYRKVGSAPTTSDYEVSRGKIWVNAEIYVYPVTAIDDTSEHYFGVTAVTGEGTESALSSTDSTSVTAKFMGGTSVGDTPAEGTGLYFGSDRFGYYDSTVPEWAVEIKSDGSVYYRGAGVGYLQWDPSGPTLIVRGTYTSGGSGVARIEIWGTGSDIGKIFAKDSSDVTRVQIQDNDITVYAADTSTLAFIPTTTGATRATNPIFSHNQVNIDNKLIVGTTGQDNPSETLYVSGTAQITDATVFGGAVTVTDHGTATNPEVIAVVYGTGSAPTANTTPIGTLFVKYTA